MFIVVELIVMYVNLIITFTEALIPPSLVAILLLLFFKYVATLCYIGRWCSLTVFPTNGDTPRSIPIVYNFTLYFAHMVHVPQ